MSSSLRPRPIVLTADCSGRLIPPTVSNGIDYHWGHKMRSLSVAVLIVCAVSSPVSARPHHRTVKTVVSPAAPKSQNIPEQKRDPADIALDRRIKGICRGC
jgi:hypothetical protein